MSGMVVTKTQMSVDSSSEDAVGVKNRRGERNTSEEARTVMRPACR